MKRRRLVAALGALLLTTSLAGPAGAGESFSEAAEEAEEAANTGQFTTVCAFSHRLSDDPILYPRRPGASHSHDFFGNTSTNAFSTLGSLRQADTTCRREGDKAAYWVPSLYVNGTAVRPRSITAYYQARGKEAGTIQPLPQAIRMIAGNAHAMSPQRLQVAAWRCSGEDGTFSVLPPTCGPGTHLIMRIRFPDCWNGRDLDAADHISHMAYNVRGACPATHPVAVPGIALNVHYLIAGGPGVTLASGSPMTGHADFVNTWDRKELKALVDRCLNTGTKCMQN